MYSIHVLTLVIVTRILFKKQTHWNVSNPRKSYRSDEPKTNKTIHYDTQRSNSKCFKSGADYKTKLFCNDIHFCFNTWNLGKSFIDKQSTYNMKNFYYPGYTQRLRVVLIYYVLQLGVIHKLGVPFLWE